jgi:hypothetical protein
MISTLNNVNKGPCCFHRVRNNSHMVIMLLWNVSVIADQPIDSNCAANHFCLNHPGFYRTCVPVTLRCEKGCCSAMTIPLWVCKAITGQTSQGQSIADGHAWTKAVVGLLPARETRLQDWRRSPSQWRRLLMSWQLTTPTNN